MNNFWTLVRFEFKKIFAKKSVFVAIILAMVAVGFSVLGLVIGSNSDTGKSNYEEMLMDKEYILEFSGRPLDGELILEASKAYQTIPPGVYPYTKSEEYQKYARPYSWVFNLIDSAYAERGKGFTFADLQTISAEDANGYYEKRLSQYSLNLANNPTYTPENVDRVIEIDSQVKKPFIIQHTNGYKRFFSFSTTNAFVVMFLIAFILSPIFVNEYSQNTAGLILTSKNGKSSQIYAKIFTGLSLGVLIATLFFAMGYLLCMFIYGFEGGNAPIQLHIPLLTYNFTMFQAVMILFITTIFGGFLMTGICLFLSSVMNRSIVVLALNVIVILLGMFSGIFPSFIDKAKYFLPSSMGTYWDVILNQYSWNIGGIDIWLYQAVCLVAFVIGSFLLLLAYGNFKRHQAE